MIVIRSLIFSLILFIVQPGYAQEVSTHALGNAVEAIVHQVTGPIDLGFADRLRAHLDADSEGYRVRLDSPGGNLVEGLAVGRLIRERGLHTEVGSLRTGDYGLELAPGACASACAIAFLGGAARSLSDPAALGFHRFYRPIDPGALPQTRDGDFDRGLAQAQIISGAVVAFMVEMGVNARVFTSGSTFGPDELTSFDRETAEALGILTPERFKAWFIEPYGAGIVAASQRQLPAQAYDQVTQATLYCSADDGRVTLMLTAPGATWLEAGDVIDPARAATLSWRGPGGLLEGIDIPISRVMITTNTVGAQIRLRLTHEEVIAIAATDGFGAALHVARASGGYTFSRSIANRDGELLLAAARHCI